MLTGDETDEEAALIIKDSIKINAKISSIFNIDSMSQFRRKFLPKSIYSYNYIILDTANKATELSTNTSFGWQVINNGATKTGAVSSVSDMKDIVGMRIYPVSIVMAAPIRDTENVNKVYVNNIANLNNNFTVLIHEMQSQAFVGRNGRKFHFSLFPALMNPTYTGQDLITPAAPYYELTTSGKNNGWFWFKTPISELNTITISIGNPFDLLTSINDTRILIPIQFIYLNDIKYTNG